MADVRDILDLERPPTPEITKETILGNTDKVKRKPMTPKVSKRPEGMHREVFALLYTDNKDAPPVFPTDTGQGYKQMKAKLGMRKVRPWKWMPFTNPARTDGAVFYHWRRVADEGKDYPFAKFNKQVPVPTYTDSEYVQLHREGWSRAETDHLFDLCRRFDLRFLVVHDRWDRTRFPARSVEDLKEHYYSACSILTRMRAPPGQEPKLYVFDADHERRRKEQLRRLFERTPEQVEEEQTLLSELRKIEARKKERERKQQDLQKLITAADSQADPRRPDKKNNKKKLQHQIRPRNDSSTSIETAGIKFPDFKSSGVSIRSQRMKLPASVGQKKTKAIETMLMELGVELMPMPTEEICQHFNELRSDMVLLYELKAALEPCEYELQTLRHQYEALNRGKISATPGTVNGTVSEEKPSMTTTTAVAAAASTTTTTTQDAEPVRPRVVTEIIDVVGSPGTQPAP